VETTTDPSLRTPAAGGAAGEPRALPAHETLVTTTVFRGTALVLGLFVLALGAFIALVAGDVVHVPDASFHAPRLVVGLIGAGTFGVAGVVFVLRGARGIARARRGDRERLLAPEAPWRWDRAWGRGGEDAPHWSRARRAVYGSAWFCAFLAAGIAVAFTTGAPTPVRAGVLVMSAIGLVPLWRAARCAAEAARYGRTFVRWNPFPAFVGERITVSFGVTRAEPAFSRMTFRLRCIEERVVETSSGRGSADAKIVAFALHEVTRTLDAEGDMPRPHVEAVLPFEIPPGLPGTDLSGDLPTYWELDVLGEAPGVDYRMQFLLPVYARS
jgi:hypothetical protein